ncbi:MAG: class I SAM-dependent methyltransferase [Candidatus Margulisbacteria bacterium]|jgi:SAM-dependent methyltransferase|nr:class I SAM-dependent methyltransferase [Candidatus Margulisiibacteriota bacterium]
MFWRAKKSYYDIYKEHQGLVSHKWTHYFFIYDLLLRRFREKGQPIKLIEIGVNNGGSLEIWKKYLPRNSEIHGIDIDEKCCALQFSKNIHFHLGNATDKKFIDKNFKDLDFDVILDDGSHICAEVKQTFDNMFPKLKPGGIYIVEDLHASYWQCYGGGFRKKESSIEFFKGLIDLLNIDYIEKRHNKKHDGIISQIQFFDSCCAITKYYQVKREPFYPVTTGDIYNVCAIPQEQKLTNYMTNVQTAHKLFGEV